MLNLLRTTFIGRCPSCGQASAFAGVFELHERCPRCGVRFERWSGSWTIPTVIGYTTGAFLAFAVAIWLFRTRGLQKHDEFIVAGVAVAGALVPYRFIKGAYVWGLWASGLVFTDDDERVPTTAR
ncbi:MAG: DUF983 domain-containing protein [Alphaproteobacteria bacterium]|nr:DUF983 domain-containing protein [Alphaproteobacteria bacterium]